jgi:hypothetical protein
MCMRTKVTFVQVDVWLFPSGCGCSSCVAGAHRLTQIAKPKPTRAPSLHLPFNARRIAIITSLKAYHNHAALSR